MQLALIDRINAHLAAGDTTDMAADLYYNPIDIYTDPARYEVEIQRLFRDGPAVAAMTADLPRQGDYVTLDLLDSPILIVRGDDGVARAFHNVCRHRGACVASGRGTGARSFMCQYHAWSYRLDGRLISTTSTAGFAALDRADRGLAEMACSESGGLIFVQLGGAPGSLDGDTWLGGLAPEFDAFGLPGYSHVETRARSWAMNWKLMLDTFGETYHVRHLHSDSIAPLIRSEPTLFDAYGPHSRQTAVRWSISELNDQPRDEWELLDHATFAYQLVPNAVMLYQQDHIELYQMFPEGPERTTAVTTLYAPDPPDEQARRRWGKALDLLLSVIDREDFMMCEQIQRSAHSGAQSDIVFGRNEPALIHSHRAIDHLLTAER